MKKMICMLTFLLSATIGFSQTITISGTVKDDQGQPIPLAFIRDMQHYYATYADSAGAFLLKADPNSVLMAIAGNYADAKVKIDNKSNINIVMAKGASSASGAPAAIAGQEGTATPFVSNQDLATRSGTNTTLKEGFTQEPTRGTPYLFVNWVRGFAVATSDSLLYNIDNLYNYDKVNGVVLFTKDMHTVMAVSKANIKSFYLFTGKLHPLSFEGNPAVSNKPFVEILLSTPKYKIYKVTDTRLERASFHTDGVTQTGNKYDEYVDAVHYYFVKGAEKPKQISIKKKTLKELLAGDADKFISSQGDRDVDDDYVRDLNFSLNQ